MSDPTPHAGPAAPAPAPDPRPRPAWLPSRTALLVVAAAFVVGLLLFLALWLDQRDNNDFFKADSVPRSVEGQAFEPLPAPLPAGQTADVDRGDDGAPDQAPGDASRSPAPAPAAPPAEPELPPESQRADSATAEASVPRPIHTPPPRYPPNAQRRGQQGTVLLRVQVDANGRPEDIDVIDGSGFRSLDRAAAEAVRRWHFEPARRDGRPVRGTVEVPVEFTLR